MSYGWGSFFWDLWDTENVTIPTQHTHTHTHTHIFMSTEFSSYNTYPCFDKSACSVDTHWFIFV